MGLYVCKTTRETDKGILGEQTYAVKQRMGFTTISENYVKNVPYSL